MSRNYQTTEREDEAAAMLSSTRLSRGVAPTLIFLFLATLLLVPLAQHFLPSQNTRLKAASPLLSLKKIPEGRELRAVEKRLENESKVFAQTRPRTQDALTRYLRAGNGEVILGADNWLFYAPEVSAITGRGFPVNTQVSAPVSAAETSTQNAIRPDQAIRHDSLPAITHLRDQLALRGIALVLMPIPVKATIYPEKLWPAYKFSERWPRNASMKKWKRELQKRGIRVLDVTPDLMLAKARGESVFVSGDTHWTPRGAEIAAQRLADFIAQTTSLPALAPTIYKRRPSSGVAPEDLVRVLGLSKNQAQFPRRILGWNAVYTPSGALSRAQKSADILILGDSFTGIYAPGGAALGQQLAFLLKRPVDWLVMPNGGSYLSRLKLAQDAARGQNHLAGKRVVVLEFTVRDLCFGDWRIIDLPK